MARGARRAVRLTGPVVYTEDFTVTASEHRLAVTRVGPSPAVEPTVLTLHGLGTTATRHTVRYVLDDLARCGLAALCFEFSGNGDSTGRLDESSLRRRRDELLAVAALLDPQVRPVLVGSSLGAHLAA
jgi:pimeloyl-ACP methyl ester carboxylesterase